MIPDTWRLIIERTGGSWVGQARKQEGCREITISTYDSPSENFGVLMEKLEQRIKQ